MLTHITHYCVHILHMSISLHPPSFDVKPTLLQVFSLQYDALQTDQCNCM